MKPRKMPAQSPGSSVQSYGTPRAFIDAVEARFGPLLHDLSASSANTKAPTFYGKADDGLAQPWALDFPRGNLWLNPEFAKIAPWAEKCAIESTARQGLVLLLTPASVGSNWFAEWVHRRSMVFALSPRLTFEGETTPYPKDLILSVYGMGLEGFSCWRWK